MSIRRITLPTELHSIIVDILAEDGDLDTVKDLALTCRSILPTCQSHIFSTLVLLPKLSGSACHETEEDLDRKLENLRCIFKHNPDLSPFVRHVHYMVRPSEDKHEKFHAFLQRLPRVKSFVLKGTISESDSFNTAVDWNTLPSSLRTALRSIFSSSCFSKLNLDHISDFPIETLLECKNLAHLTIVSSDFDDSATLESDDALVLRSLTFTEYSSRAVHSLINAKNSNGLPVVDFSQLRDLKSFDKTGDMVVPKLLQTSQAIEFLSCTAWDSFNKPFQDFVKPSTLRTLKLFNPIIIIPPWLGLVPLDPLYCLPEEFEKWATYNILEAIYINVACQKDAKLPEDLASWKELNSLAVGSGFPFLREVCLLIHLAESPTSREVKERLEARQHELFGPLMDTTKFVFRFAVLLVRDE